MTSEFIAEALSVAAIVSFLCRLLYQYYRKKKAIRRLILQYMQDSFQNEYDYMTAYLEIIRKTCQKNAKKKFRKKG